MHTSAGTRLTLWLGAPALVLALCAGGCGDGGGGGDGDPGPGGARPAIVIGELSGPLGEHLSTRVEATAPPAAIDESTEPLPIIIAGEAATALSEEEAALLAAAYAQRWPIAVVHPSGEAVNAVHAAAGTGQDHDPLHRSDLVVFAERLGGTFKELVVNGGGDGGEDMIAQALGDTLFEWLENWSVERVTGTGTSADLFLGPQPLVVIADPAIEVTLATQFSDSYTGKTAHFQCVHEVWPFHETTTGTDDYYMRQSCSFDPSNIYAQLSRPKTSSPWQVNYYYCAGPGAGEDDSGCQAHHYVDGSRAERAARADPLDHQRGTGWGAARQRRVPPHACLPQPAQRYLGVALHQQGRQPRRRHGDHDGDEPASRPEQRGPRILRVRRRGGGRRRRCFGGGTGRQRPLLPQRLLRRYRP
jgi:hypothetical protein